MRRLPLTFALLALAACRATSNDAGVRADGGGPAVNISTSKKFYTVSSSDASIKLAELRSLSLAIPRSGRIEPDEMTNRQYLSIPRAADPALAVDFALGTSDGRACRPASAAGAPFSGAVAVACATDTEAFAAIEALCAKMAEDPKLAAVDGESCVCRNRKVQKLAFADYRGNAARFEIDCKNAATEAELKGVCADIVARTCGDCKVEAERCGCPSGVTLSYKTYVSDVEGFRAACGG